MPDAIVLDMPASTEYPYNPPYAGFWRRFAASVIDVVIIFALMLIPLILLSVGIGIVLGLILATQPESKPVISGISNLVGWLFGMAMCVGYYGYFETQKAGVTWGRKALGLALISQTGQPVTFGQSALRQVLRGLSNICLGLGHLTQLFTPNRQTVHDMVTKTVVVRTRVQDAWVPWLINGVAFVLWISVIILLVIIGVAAKSLNPALDPNAF